jgi:hypothetical protein
MFGLFKKRVDPRALHSASSMACERLRANVALFCNLRRCEQDEVEEAINLGIETHMFALAVTMTLLNFTIQDAYYDAGLASPIDPMPDFRISADEERAATRDAWAFVRNSVVRMNIDTRYRYICVNKLNSPEEAALWQQMGHWSDFEVRRSIEAKQELSTGWLAFCMALRGGDQQAARDYLARTRL